MTKQDLAQSLARCFLAGERGVEAMVLRGQAMLGRKWNWLWPVARNWTNSAHDATRWRHAEVVSFLLRDSAFNRAWSSHSHKFAASRWLTESHRMQPVAAALSWDIPSIETAGALADWFWLNDQQLAWFADLEGLTHKSGNSRFSHYHYRVLRKENGAVRIIEAPKPRLKEMQRQILEHILNPIPTHPAAHGFVRGRSILTFAAPHVAKRAVLRLDLKDFFPSSSCARIQAFFRTIGYPELVADLLGGICTSATPAAICRNAGLEWCARRHLPQGAPTSPALANLCFYRMDCRLAGLAKFAGANYTRYADDLAFSGGDEFAKSAERFATYVAALVTEEGFALNHRKTRIMRPGVRQHLAGLVINDRLNVRRADFDRLKAILTNCIRRGPQAESADQLSGKIGFVEMVNPARGAKLRALFTRIVWP